MTTTTAPMTTRQRQFIANLFEERVTDSIVVPPLEAMTTKMASAMIGQLLAAPKKQQQVAKRLIPDGRYAVDTPEGLRFYVVNTRDRGPYAGVQFISRQSGDNRLRIGPNERSTAKVLIAADPKAATVRYGRELGVCGVCGRTLTDEESRAAGIGPVCAARF